MRDTIAILSLTAALLTGGDLLFAKEKVVFNRDFSPAEGLVSPQEKPYRQEICLNGLWDFQPVAVPRDWKQGNGVAPILTEPREGQWEQVKIKIPSPWNVNDWGGGIETGEGSKNPYAPSSVYYPSYPSSWIREKMGWLRREFSIPADWKKDNRLILHFEAVAGECVVKVNGKEVCRNFDQYLPFDADVTDYIDWNKPNELLVGVRHNTLFQKFHPEYKKMKTTYALGSNTDKIVGIWQDVFLWAVPEVRVTEAFIKPWVDRDELEIDVNIINQSRQLKTILLGGDAREWINNAGKTILDAPEIKWTLGHTALTIDPVSVTLKPGETQKVTLQTKVGNRLKLWSPETPNLYMLSLKISDKKQTYDIKDIRFGWRQFKLSGTDFLLNGKKIQCIGDIQHPFGPYICSRRFAWAWLQMIKDFGGNSVRPHAQPWPRVYYDLADEMGIMVLDETGLFGSSINLNFEAPEAWEHYAEHLERLILRDRNHPSVIGWSVGNELFAIALLNKPSKEVAKKWDDKIVELADRVPAWDPTRGFITCDGDRDLDGRLPVWSKHFGHGLKLDLLPEKKDKPMIVGESGATYYGKPDQLYQFAGDKPYISYFGRNEALAVDVYQNVQKMAKPFLAYYSPSEVCWFGLEHLNLGYGDYSRLPDGQDGVFAGKVYEEGKPGYQFERIPPYVTTFNPGIDLSLPLYKPLPMFHALKAALADKPCEWDHYTELKIPKPAALPQPVHSEVFFIGDKTGALAGHLRKTGITFSKDKKSSVVIVDGENIDDDQLKQFAAVMKSAKKSGRTILIMTATKGLDSKILPLLPANIETTNRTATAFNPGERSEWGGYFTVPALYFSEIDSKEPILKQGLSGAFVDEGTIVFDASGVDWSLFNRAPENRKCAQVVLYEKLQKPSGVAMVTYPLGKSVIAVSSINYLVDTKETAAFWERFFSVMKIDLNKDNVQSGKNKKVQHDLLLDGPVDSK